MYYILRITSRCSLAEEWQAFYIIHVLYIHEAIQNPILSPNNGPRTTCVLARHCRCALDGSCYILLSGFVAQSRVHCALIIPTLCPFFHNPGKCDRRFPLPRLLKTTGNTGCFEQLRRKCCASRSSRQQDIRNTCLLEVGSRPIIFLLSSS